MLLCCASKRFMKAFKVFIKPSLASQRSVEIKFTSVFSLRPGSGREGLAAHRILKTPLSADIYLPDPVKSRI